MKALLRMALPSTGPAWGTADPVPHGERLVGLAVVAFLLLALFA